MPIYSCEMVTETGWLSLFSFILTMTNIICIIGEFGFDQECEMISFLTVVAMVILRVKEVVPIMRDDEIGERTSSYEYFEEDRSDFSSILA